MATLIGKVPPADLLRPASALPISMTEIASRWTRVPGMPSHQLVSSQGEGMSMEKCSLIRRIAIIVMSTVAFVGVGGLAAQAANASVSAVATPAKAASGALLASRSDCGSGNFCAWDNYNFSGGPGQWSGNASNYTAWGHSGCGVTSLWTWDNCVSSVFNNGNNCNLTFYDGTGYTGAYYNLPRGSYLAHMDQDRMSDGKNANDRISSHHWCTF